jgi:hypothetical protein
MSVTIRRVYWNWGFLNGRPPLTLEGHNFYKLYIVKDVGMLNE